jgi:hypothetical protein
VAVKVLISGAAAPCSRLFLGRYALILGMQLGGNATHGYHELQPSCPCKKCLYFGLDYQRAEKGKQDAAPFNDDILVAGDI